MTEIDEKLIDKYKKRKAFPTGAKSVAMILTGMVEAGKEYVTWKEDNGDVIIREMKGA
jgi:hypothetical protein